MLAYITRGAVGPFAAVYNRHHYRDEGAVAGDTLGRFVMTLVHPETAPSSLVALRH